MRAEAVVRSLGDREPRFALRFEAGRGILSLARPFAFGLGAIESMELDLGRLPSPIDLRAGASRFRHRRAALVRARIRVDLDALAAELSAPGLELRTMAAAPDAIAVAMRDPVRTIAFELVPAWEGSDLVIAVRGARAAIEGSRAPIADVLRALASRGAPLVPERGVVRVDRPVERVLAEALLPAGWRVPSARGLARAAPHVDGRTLRIVLGEQGEPTLERARAALEDARAIGPVLDALAADREDDAEAIVLGAQTRLGPPSEELEAIAGELAHRSPRAGYSPSTASSATLAGPRRISLALREALARHDVDRAAHLARELASVEPDGDLAIEGLRAASALAADDDPATAADLSARALARRPRDAALALEWLERVSRAIEGEQVSSGVRAIRAQVTGPQRASVLRACATVLERAGQPGEARACWDEAARLAPDDADVIEGLARTLGGAEALEAWDRVAQLRASDPDAQARALIHAARVARAHGHGAGAATRLERAAEIASDDRVRVDALASLAEARRALGAREAATEADARLLELADRMTGPAVLAALRAAAGAAIEERAEPRARALLAAMTRAGAPDEDVLALSAAIDRWELEALDRDAPEQAEAIDPADRALRARAIAERLRAAGRFGDAARALARAGAILRDAATLRAAVELAEKGHDWRAALEVIDRAIEVVGSGPAKSALEARREAIRARH